MSKPLRRPDAVNVAHIVDCCGVIGPGRRLVVWVQGCPLRCPGCQNSELRPFTEADWVSVRDLAERALAAPGIEGVTFSGGDPFAQAEALAEVADRIRREGITVMAYSGYTFAQLASNAVPGAGRLLKMLDLLLDGPYRQNLPTSRPWRGSDNQRLIALSPRYAQNVEVWNRPAGQEFEVRLTEAGRIEVLGIPPSSLSRDPTLPDPRSCLSANESPRSSW